MIKGSFSIEEQRKVTKLRWSKSLRVAVVDVGVGLDISNVATNSRAYGTNLGLYDKEIREKVSKSNRGTISFGEAIAGGLEAHNFNCNTSIKTATPGKKGKGKDEETTNGKTLVVISFMTPGGITTSVSITGLASHDQEKDDNDSFASSVNSTQPHLVVNMSGNNFNDTQDELPKPDERPGQEKQAGDFNSTAIAASQTRLITKAVQGLLMIPEEDENT